MAKHKNTVGPPHEPSRDEMLRFQAESFVRDSIGKSPGFQQEVNRVLRELKRLDKTVAVRKGKPE